MDVKDQKYDTTFSFKMTKTIPFSRQKYHQITLMATSMFTIYQKEPTTSK